MRKKEVYSPRVSLRRFLPADLLCAVAAVLFLAAVLFSLSNPTGMDDGLRHFAMARTMADRGIFAIPGWSEFFYAGTLSQSHVDPWFLSDAILSFFAPLQAISALKAFVLLSVVLFTGSFLALLRLAGLRGAAAATFLLLVLAGDPQFLGRFLLARPFALQTAVFLMILWSVLGRRVFLTAFLLAVAVLLSQLFVFPLLLCLARICWLLLLKRRKEGMTLLLAVAVGTSAGILLHPESFAYAEYLFTVFLRVPFLKSTVELSREMQTSVFDVSMMSVLILTGACCLFFVQFLTKRDAREILRSETSFLFLIAAGLLMAYFIWVRALDLLWPMLVYLLAVLWEETGREFPLFDSAKIRARTAAFVLLLCVVQMSSVFGNFLLTDHLRGFESHASLAVLRPGSRVLNLSWGTFFVAVLLRPDVSYATGIDPSFLAIPDIDSARDLAALTDDAIEENTSDIALRERVARVEERYPSDYLVVPGRGYGRTLAALSGDARYRLLSATGAVAIFEVRSNTR